MATNPVTPRVNDAISSHCSGLSAAMLITMLASDSAHCGAKSDIAASIPGLVNPMEFSNVVSPAASPSRNDSGNQRGSGLPDLAWRVKVLGNTAPSLPNGVSGAIPRP